MYHNFKDQIILVTGGTGALGMEVSELFVKSSPRAVVITYRNDSDRLNTEERLDALFSDHENENNKTEIEFARTDILKENEVQNLVDKIIDKYGRIHVLANIVGGYFGGETVDETTEQEWEKMMNINLKSAFLITKYILKPMKMYRFGKILHVSSASGERAIGMDSAYSSSKAGLIRLVQSVKEEVKDFEININCILPTIIDTSSNRRAMPTADFQKWLKPQDLARLIVFLCSEDSKVINGTAIKTSGYA